MKILSFEKPKKLRSSKEHNEKYMNESGHAWIPNMSEKDMEKWRAKHITGKDERIEIRKTFSGTQVLIVVFKNKRFTKWEEDRVAWSKNHNNVRISANGKIDMTFDQYDELKQAIEEAKQILLNE